MMKKQKKTQPFIYYCLEKQQLDPALKGKSLPELVELCGGEWTSMGPEERLPYVESAKQLNAGRIEPTFHSNKSIGQSPKSDLAGKFDSFGRSYLAIRNKEVQAKSELVIGIEITFVIRITLRIFFDRTDERSAAVLVSIIFQ